MEYEIERGGKYADRITNIQRADDNPKGSQEGIEPETF